MAGRISKSRRGATTLPRIGAPRHEEEGITFSFKHLVEESYCDCPDATFFIKLLGRLKTISGRSLPECATADRHSIIGTEKIPLPQFAPAVQRAARDGFEEVEKLTVFRAAGDNRAMAGVLLGGVFYIIGIEARINTLSRHGKRK